MYINVYIHIYIITCVCVCVCHTMKWKMFLNQNYTKYMSYCKMDIIPESNKYYKLLFNAIFDIAIYEVYFVSGVINIILELSRYQPCKEFHITKLNDN